jgi:hypothetical protein
MSTKAILLVVGLVLIAGGGAWFVFVRGAGELPKDCRFVVLTNAGRKTLTLQDLKQQVAMLESPQLAGTPRLEGEMKKLRSCIQRAGG